MLRISTIEKDDWNDVWQIIEPVFRQGETYPIHTDISEADAFTYWVMQPSKTYVAKDKNGCVVGTYYLKPNQTGPAAHVCNCGYIVGENHQGKGIAKQMCQHSQDEAVKDGFLAMQYNLVISTNEVAVHLWQSQGFELIGTLPGAFKHPRLGFVDAHVMYKKLQTH
ncbi:MAG: GNAT family N-acetyltransferase [Rhodospirillaceae bacterium]|nr:GNAT family N-acetyltransferase [Rhodospirillaceae bacterium]